MVTEETVVCVHNEVMEGYIGTCSLCGQMWKHDPLGSPPKLIKRGQIDGVLTDVNPVLDLREKAVPSPPGARLESPSLLPKQALQPLKPPDWDKMGIREKKKWLDEHREEILKDVGELGQLKARKRWGISSSTWVGLKRRWGKEVPWRPKKKKKLQAYFEKNKEAIIKDYNTMFRRDFLKKWHLSPETWTRLQKEWEVLYKILWDRGARPQQKFTLPEFPAFNDKWGDSVQVKWLEVYPELYREANAKSAHKES